MIGQTLADRTLEAALNDLGRHHPREIDLSLGRIEARLAALGNPERSLPPVFHVAGTNGKGSTVAFLRAFLEAAGYSVHAYTSPHLVRFNERIRIAGKLIADDVLMALIDEIDRAGVEQPITIFEAITAIAFLAFARTPADAALIEVGLGGRYDATNLFEKPRATAATRISYDHRQFFGNVITDIAREKAGIFKTGVPAVVANQPDPDVREVFIAEAASIDAQLFLYGRDWSVSPSATGFRYDGPGRSIDLPPPALLGRHQWMNAGTALTLLDVGGGFSIDDDAIRRALAAVEWPGRLQRLRNGPLFDLLPPSWELWLDGAHNDSGAEAVAHQAAEWSDRPLDLVFGIRGDRIPAEVLGPLAPYVMRLRSVITPGDPVSVSADVVASAARDAGIRDAEPMASLASAVASLAQASGPRRILICGSLYLAGAVLAEHG
jgi:dihydrofolate synthase/folylpolyglutamate synthase